MVRGSMLRRNLQFEAVAESRHRAYGAGAKNASQTRNLCRKIVFIDNDTWPDALQQRGLGHQPALVLDEHEQQVESAPAEFHGLARCAQHPLRRIELESSETYQVHQLHPGRPFAPR